MVRSVSPTDLAQKAFVRGLGEDIDEDSLRRTFSKFGEVVEVHIAKDRETNIPRGFAFITFANSTECNKACMSMDGKEFHGRSLQVELATHSNKGVGGRGGFRGGRGGSGFRGGRGRGSSPPSSRGGSYRRGTGYRGSWRGGSSRGEYRGYGSRGSDSFYSSEDRFRGSVERDPPPRDYGSSRYESGGYDYRSSRSERDYGPPRDYPSYRGRDYPPAGERDYGPPRDREYPPYYSPPRDYPSGGRDYPGSRGRDYPPRADHDFESAPRRYAPREYDDYPPSGNGYYDSRPPRRDYGPPPRDYGGAGRYDGYEGGRGHASYKSRGSFAGRGGRDVDYGRGMGGARRVPRDDDRPPAVRRSMRSPDGPSPKKMKMHADVMRRSPRGARF